MADDLYDKAIKLVQALGVIGGLAYTGVQLRDSAANQRSALLYQIQSDGRSVLKDATANRDFAKCLRSMSSCGPGELDKAEDGVRLVVQFYSSVHNQVLLGTLSRRHWNVWRTEICALVKSDLGNAFWKSYGDGYRQEFRKELDGC